MRYERVGAPSSSPSPPSSQDLASAPSMSANQKVLSFPLESDLQEVELPSLPEGRYVVCAEAVRARDGAVLEEQCFVTNVRAVREQADSGKA